MRTPKIIAVEGAEPVTLTEARAHLEAQAYEDSDVDPTDDAMIEAWIVAAREMCEQFLGVSLVTKTLEIAMDKFPVATDDGGTAIDLPMGPVREVLQIMVPPPETEYTSDDVDSDDLADVDIWADGQVNPDLYVLDDYRSPNQIKPAGAAWPTITAATNAVKVRYLAGYAVDSDGGEALPKMIRASVLLLIADLYEHRGAGDPGVEELPPRVKAILRPHRIRLGIA